MSYDYKLGMFHYFIMIMRFPKSSSIAAVSFGTDNAVGVTFTSADKEYGFLAKDANLVRTGLENALTKGESVGRLIASYRAEGQLTAV